MKINNYIEHTLLKPDVEYSDVEKLIQEAIKYDFLGVCINPCFVDFAHRLLENKKTKLVTVVNFPLASNNIKTTLYQIETALKDGADEIDTVLNIPALKSKDYKKAKEDIIQSKSICKDNILKVIIETDVLNKDEIILASKIAIEAGADFVKTSTGFVKGGVGAKVEDVKLMFEAIKPYNGKIKASGGIKDYKKALDLIEAGALRLGTSSGADIILGEKE